MSPEIRPIVEQFELQAANFKTLSVILDRFLDDTPFPRIQSPEDAEQCYESMLFLTGLGDLIEHYSRSSAVTIRRDNKQKSAVLKRPTAARDSAFSLLLRISNQSHSSSSSKGSRSSSPEIIFCACCAGSSPTSESLLAIVWLCRCASSMLSAA